MSSELVWQLVRNSNAFLIKQKSNGTTFSREKFNLRNKHSFKDSGIANKQGIDVSAVKGGVKVSTKVARFANQPAKQVRSVTPKVALTRAARPLAKIVVGEISSANF